MTDGPRPLDRLSTTPPWVPESPWDLPVESNRRDAFIGRPVSLPPVGGCLLGPALALHAPEASRSAPLSFNISPVEMIRSLLPRLEGGDIRIRIPLKPGEYPVEWGGSFLDASYVVREGYAEARVRFSSGRITEFRTDFHPPFNVEIHRIGIPVMGLPLTYLLDADVEGTYLVTGGDCPSRRGRIFADVDNTGPNFLIPDPDMTALHLKSLGFDDRRERFPETMQELADALLNRPPPPTSSGVDAEPLPLDLDRASITSATVRVCPGSITTGPITVRVGGGPDGRGTVYTLRDSNRTELHTGPIAFEAVLLRDTDGNEIARLRDFLQGGLNVNVGDTIAVRGDAGSLGTITGHVGSTSLSGNRISWNRVSVHFNQETGEAWIRLPGLQAEGLRAGDPNFSIQNLRGDLFAHRQRVADGEILEMGLDTSSLHIQSALFHHPALELELGESDLLQANFGVQVRLPSSSAFDIFDPSQVSFGFGFSSPEFRIQGGNVNIESFSNRKGERVIIFPSSLRNVRVDFDGEEMTLRGESAVNLSQMRFQFGRGMGFPLETDLTFARTRVTGPIEQFRIINIMGQRPGGLRMRIDGNLRLSGDGSGVIESSDPINRFRFRTGQLGYTAAVRHVRLEEGKMQELEMGEARLDLQSLSGTVSAFQTVETNLEPDSGATVSISGLEADLRTFRREQERATSPIRIARFTGFTIDLSAHSHQNVLHLAPQQHDHGRDLHLVRRSVQTEVDQTDNIADIMYDPATGRTRLLFRGGGLRIRSVSQ